MHVRPCTAVVARSATLTPEVAMGTLTHQARSLFQSNGRTVPLRKDPLGSNPAGNLAFVPHLSHVKRKRLRCTSPSHVCACACAGDNVCTLDLFCTANRAAIRAVIRAAIRAAIHAAIRGFHAAIRAATRAANRIRAAILIRVT